MLERNEVTKIERWLRRQYPGCYLLKLESPSTAGILDLYFLWTGWHAWFEVKLPKYRTRTWKNKKIQEWHIKEIKKNGGRAYFVFSLDDVQDIMRAAGLLK